MVGGWLGWIVFTGAHGGDGKEEESKKGMDLPEPHTHTHLAKTHPPFGKTSHHPAELPLTHPEESPTTSKNTASH